MVQDGPKFSVAEYEAILAIRTDVHSPRPTDVSQLHSLYDASHYDKAKV